MFTIILIVFLIILITLILYLFAIKPNSKRKDDMKSFEAVYIAHRGLFDNDSEYPENSILAFKRAVEAGYGIELDVQKTADDNLVVFHDESLKGMCGVDRVLNQCSLEELRQYSLLNSSQKIPLLSEVLEVINGKVPLIMEIKSEGDWKTTTRMAAETMDNYNGEYCMESLHPFAVQWYKKNRPYIIRGQLSTDFFKDEPQMGFAKKFLLSNLMLNWASRPDFIAFNHKHANMFSYRLIRKLFPVVNVAWTIKSPEELKAAEKVFDVIIFDNFIP